MKVISLLILLSVMSISSYLQKNKYKSCIKIGHVEFAHHQAYFNFIKKANVQIKHNGVIRIKTDVKDVVLKDDGEFKEYKYVGELNTPLLILIHELEPNTEEYYLINKKTARIDTLVGKPIFSNNGTDIVCLEGSGTDTKQKIQVGKLINGSFKTEYLFTMKDGINPDYVYWFNTNTIFIKARKDYWKLTF
ncbi:hypothetical protein ACPPVU_03580 [Mucilaginibacter sp. McL0603]|uniref:hypothetical protein n=1 Tax=Mucilaginibacter sp. McL0603 TaxID=3415670 RepID=UPI003CEF041D